ncbi:unnamed protein product [Sphagnum jensenii]|uniref:Uncharacterized protein n=1 Tax=Sphagnum jensenii TaxID=128206 RepID=A0ABP1BSH3_9BRYO
MITKSMRKHNNKVVRGSEAGAASSWSELADQDLAGEQLNMRRETKTERVRVTSVSGGGEMQQMMRSTGKGLLPYEAKLFGHCVVLLLQMISKGEKKFLLSKVAPLPACLPQILFYCRLFGA